VRAPEGSRAAHHGINIRACQVTKNLCRAA
jgi:hypothetical protein